MKKRVVLIMVIGFFTMLNGCNVAKRKFSNKEKKSAAENVTIGSSKTKIDTSIFQNAISTTGKEATYTEEYTVRNPQVDLKDIEISANFKVDTSSILSGDTVLKLIDIKNGNTSLTIYQNRKTKQLMAKVKTPDGVRKTEFSEISLKRSLSTKDTKTVDSSTIRNAVTEKSRDTLAINRTTETKIKTETKEKETKPNYLIWGGLALLLIGFAFWRLGK